MPTKLLQEAVDRAALLPDPLQEEMGREMIARIEVLERLRADVMVGIDELDAGLGQTLDIEALIAQVRSGDG